MSKGKDGAKNQPPPAPEPLRVPVADSHTHLDMQDGAVEAAVAAAAAVGVTTLIQVGTDVASSEWSASVAAEHTAVWATVALHPNEAPRLVHGDPDGWSGQDRRPGGPEALAAALERVDTLAALPQVRGIGETGLDYFRTKPDGVAVQQESFRAHIRLAKRHRKPLVIHDRDAHDDVLRILTEEGLPDTVVFHCFSGDEAFARRCVEAGCYLSFAGPVTFKPNDALRAAAAVVPADHLLVETDAPFLTPVPYRGRPNAPYLIPLTLRALAAAKDMPEDDLAAAVAANSARVFGPFGPT